MTFETWMKEVDAATNRLAMVSIHDLADANFRDAYDDGATPTEMAKETLQDAGWGELL